MTIPTITALPTPPSRTAPATFASLADAFLAALPTFGTEANAMAAAYNAETPALYRMTRRAITTGDTAVLADKGGLLDLSGTFTLATSAAATLGSGWWCVIRNSGTGTVTLDPNASETVDGVTSGAIYPGFAFILQTDGTAFYLVRLSGRRREVLTAGTSWTCPLGVRRAFVRVQGPGGSGGRASSTSRAMAGSAGGYADAEISVTPGTAYAYTIGTPGAAVGVDNTAGADATATTFNTGAVTLTANGGKGGTNASTTGISAPGGSATNGDVNRSGTVGRLVTDGGAQSSTGGDAMLGSGGVLSATGTLTPGFGGGGAGSQAGTSSQAGGAACIVMEY